MARRLKLGQLLISKGLLDPEQLASALAEQERWGSRLGMTLVRMGYVEEDVLVKMLSRQLQLPVARIAGKRVKPEILERVPVELAEKYRCIPLFTREEAGAELLFVGMDDPSDLKAIDELSFRIEQEVRPVLVAPTELEEALQRNYHRARRAAAPAAAEPAAPAPAAGPLPAMPGFVPEPDTAPEAGAAAPGFVPERDTAPDASLEISGDPAMTLPPLGMSAAPPGPEEADDPDTETEPQLPPMDPVLAGLADDPILDGLEDDPVLGDLDHDPVLGGDDLSDPAGTSFSAVDEEAVADLARSPFGDSDPELGGFAGGPFGAPDDEPPDDLEQAAFGSDLDPEAAPAPATDAAASLEATVIMQALAQLLVEKGVIGREEFAERLRRLAAKKPKPA